MNNNIGNIEDTGDEFADLKGFLLKNKLFILIVAIAAITLSIAIPVYRHRVQNNQLVAMQAFFSSKSLQDLENIMLKYPSTEAAPLTLLKIGKTFYDNGTYQMAIEKYTEFTRKFKDHRMLPAAEIGKAYCTLAMDNTGEALAMFRNFMTTHSDHYLLPQAVFGQILAMEQAGAYEDAKITCENFIAANPESPWIPRAEEMLENLRKNIPANTLTDTQATEPSSASLPENQPQEQ